MICILDLNKPNGFTIMFVLIFLKTTIQLEDLI